MDALELLYGFRPDVKRIVGAHEHKDDSLLVYQRLKDDRIRKRVAKFKPYGMFHHGVVDALQEQFVVEEISELKGPGRIDRMVRFKGFVQFHKIKSWAGKELGDDDYFIETDPVTQWLQQTGITFFGGMAMDDILRMQIDLEVWSDGQFPNAEREGDYIFIIAISDNRGYEEALYVEGDAEVSIDGPYRRMPDEERMLRELVKIIHRRNPDSLEFHNGVGFDLPYLRDRCEMHGVNFGIGRDNSVPRSFTRSKDFAEAEIQFQSFQITGRSVIDSMFEAMDYDVYKRDLPGYGLKQVAKHFGVAAEDRTYIEGSKLASTWDTDPDRVLRYALDDVRETKAIMEVLGDKSFELTSMVPWKYQKVQTGGQAKAIEALMARSYIRAGYAFPERQTSGTYQGAYSELFRRGVFENLAYADVSSLYPSNMMVYRITSRNDYLGTFLPLLEGLTDLRLKTKKKMREMEDGPEKRRLDAKQSSYKTLINCFAPGHEMMTLDGAKPIEDVQVGDVVPSLNTETGKTEWKRVTRVYKQENYTGDMVKIQNRYVDLLVTPNHRMFTRQGSSSYSWKQASDLLNTKQRHKLPKPSPLDQGIYLEEFKLSHTCNNLNIDYKTGPRGIKDPRRQARWIPDQYDIEDVLSLMGWYVSEGSVYVSKRKEYETTTRGVSHNIQIANKTDGERQKIKALLERMGLNYYEGQNGYTFSNKLWGEVLTSMFGKGSANKGLPQWLFVQPARRLKYFWDTMYLGDGNKKMNRYTTKSERLAKDVKRLAFHMGWRSHITKDSGVYRVIILKDHGGSAPVVKHSHRDYVHYNGPIYCVEVKDNHTVYAGRNGKMNWVGQSFYGSMGTRFFQWCDIQGASRVCLKGQYILKRMIHEIQDRGGTVVLCDTDGVLFKYPEGMSKSDVNALIQEISDSMPVGIEIDNDGFFDKAIAYKPKNYALLPAGADEFKVKGVSLKGRSKEPFLLEFLQRQLQYIFDGDVQAAHDDYMNLTRQIAAKNLSVDALSKRARVKMNLDTYVEKKVEGDENQLPQYEVALRADKIHDYDVLKGDMFRYYIGGGNAKHYKSYKRARLVEEYDNDENVYHYLDRLKTTVEILQEMVEKPGAVYPDPHHTAAQHGLFDNSEQDLGGLVTKIVKEVPDNPSDRKVFP